MHVTYAEETAIVGPAHTLSTQLRPLRESTERSKLGNQR